MEAELIINGEKILFNVIEDYTYPCPVCGAYACNGEYYLTSNSRKAIRIDRGDLDMLMYDYLSENIFKASKQNEYENLPQFLREYNEYIGWKDSDDIEYPIDTTDFINTLNLIISGCGENNIKMCSALKKFAEVSLVNKSGLFIIQY